MCGACIVSFSAEDNTLIVLAAADGPIKKAALLSEMHVRALRQKMLLKQKTIEISKKLEVSVERASYETSWIMIMNAVFKGLHSKITMKSL